MGQRAGTMNIFKLGPPVISVLLAITELQSEFLNHKPKDHYDAEKTEQTEKEQGSHGPEETIGIHK